jgi:hypothetical protein
LRGFSLATAPPDILSKGRVRRAWVHMIGLLGHDRAKKLRLDKAWSERDLFALGLGIGHGAARNQGQEHVIAELAKLLKRKEDEVRDKLVGLGILSGTPQGRRNQGIGKTKTRAGLRATRSRARTR